jgi:hypothetical protein
VTSCIWHISEKIGLFLALLSAPVKAASGDKKTPPDAACTVALKKSQK